MAQDAEPGGRCGAEAPAGPASAGRVEIHPRRHSEKILKNFL